MLAGNPEADNAQLRTAQVPDSIISMLDRLLPGQSDSLASAGDVASAIAAIEMASTQRTEAYQAGSMVPGGENSRLTDAAINPTQDLSEAPTLVAPIVAGPLLFGNEIEGQAVSGQPLLSPERITMPLGAYVSPVDGEQHATLRRKPVPWLLPVSLLLLLLIMGFVLLRLLGPVTRVEGQAAVSPTSTSLTNVTVPDLRGKNFDQATGMVKTMGLGLAPGVSDYNATYAAGEIAAQQPAPGERVLAGSPITISLSLGQAPIATVAPKPPAPAPPAPQPNNGQGDNRGKPKKGHK